MLKSILIFLVLGLTFIVGCQVTQPPTVSATPTAAVVVANTIPAVSTEEPTLESVKTAVATATLTDVPLPIETAMPTPLPTNTPTPDLVWSILFTGAPCEETSSSCESMGDYIPLQNYFINSDGKELHALIEMEGISDNISNAEIIILSPNQNRVAVYTGDRFLIGDVGGDTYSEIDTDIAHFYPFSFYGDDPNCLAGFDEQKEDGVITTKLYKSCIGDTEPALIDTAVFPSEYTGLTYLLSPQGDKWLVYKGGVLGGDQTASLYTKEIGDSTALQPIFQQQGVSCSHAIHWQDNETIEFVYALCGDSKDRPIYFYVIDWEGIELTTRYELPALQEPPSESSISTNYYVPEIGDWFGDNNMFAFSISRFGDLTPAFNGLYILNLTTGEVQQILSNYRVFAIRPWLPLPTSEE